MGMYIIKGCLISAGSRKDAIDARKGAKAYTEFMKMVKFLDNNSITKYQFLKSTNTLEVYESKRLNFNVDFKDGPKGLGYYIIPKSGSDLFFKNYLDVIGYIKMQNIKDMVMGKEPI